VLTFRPKMRMKLDLEAWSSLLTCSDNFCMVSSRLAIYTLADASSSRTAVFSTLRSWRDLSMLSILAKNCVCIWLRAFLISANCASIAGSRVLAVGGEGGVFFGFLPISCVCMLL
jgi:hypothetical protein